MTQENTLREATSMNESKESAAKTRRQFLGGALVGLAGGLMAFPRLGRWTRASEPRARPRGPIDTVFEPISADAVRK